MRFKGAIKGQLQAVETLIEANKGDLGLAHVQIGERRVYTSPACFITMGPGGAPEGLDSGIEDLEEYDVHVQITVLTKTYQESDDLNVIGILEAIADLIDTNAPVGNARSQGFPNPAAVGPFGIDERGVYETIGVQEVIFQIEIDRR